MSFVVFGSIDKDLVAHSTRLPKPGQTLTRNSFQTFSSGKGVNQAVTCARLGALFFMVGRVGGDLFGKELKDGLGIAGVDHQNVDIDKNTSSGVALIMVEDSAENMIIVIPGANGEVGEGDPCRLEDVLSQSQVLLLRLEISLKRVFAASKLAKGKVVKEILDPAPAQALLGEINPLLDTMTPDEIEAEILLCIPIKTKEGAVTATKIFKVRGVQNVIIKIGSFGAYTLIDEEEKFFNPIQDTPIHTVAAGDALSEALAVALCEKRPIQHAIRWGMAGGALSIIKQCT